MAGVMSPAKPVASGKQEPRVNIIEKSDEEILAMANLLWRDLVKA